MNKDNIINKEEGRVGQRLGGERFLRVLGALALCLGLAACGGTRYLPSGGSSEEETGSVVAPPPTDVAVPEIAPGGLADEASRPVAQMPKASTRVGQGRLVRVTVRRGDSLWTVARRKDVYGSGWLYPLLYKANRALIADPNRLSPGIVLKIPRDVPDPEVEKAEEEAMTGQYLDRSPLPTGRRVKAALSGSAPADGSGDDTADADTGAPVAAPGLSPVSVSARAAGSSRLLSGNRGWTLMFLLVVVLGLWIFMRLARDDSENGG